jgi:hypothetical protein
MSETAKHSPAPWHYEAGFGLLPEVRDADGAVVCTVAAGLPVDREAEANARLIAAAPRVLAAALRALEALEEVDDADLEGVRGELRDAVAEAC